MWLGDGDSGLVERNGNDFVPAEVANITDFDGQIIPRLPLKIERVVDGVGQFVGAVVGGKREQLLLRSGSLPVFRRRALQYSAGNC